MFQRPACVDDKFDDLLSCINVYKEEGHQAVKSEETKCKQNRVYVDTCHKQPGVSVQYRQAWAMLQNRVSKCKIAH